MRFPSPKGSTQEERGLVLEEFSPDVQVTPWPVPKEFEAYRIPIPSGRGAIKKLSEEIDGLDVGGGLRMVYEDFGVPEGWPGEKPEQIAFLWRKEADRAKPYEMIFVKSTEPVETVEEIMPPRGVVPREAKPGRWVTRRGRIWRIPHAITRSDPYPLARAVLGRQRDLATYGHRPSEMWMLVPE